MLTSLWISLFMLICLPLVDCWLYMSLEMIRFTNPNNDCLYKGSIQCCLASESVDHCHIPCDPNITILVSLPTTNIKLVKRVGYLPSLSTIDFSKFSNISNPTYIRFDETQSTIQLTILAVDGSNNRVILNDTRTIQLSLKGMKLSIFQSKEASFFISTQAKICREGNHTHCSDSGKLECDDTYYGDNCTTRCIPPPSYSGHCLPNGTLVCFNDWTGPDCSKRLVCTRYTDAQCSPGKCREPIGSQISYSCHCPSGYRDIDQSCQEFNTYTSSTAMYSTGDEDTTMIMTSRSSQATTTVSSALDPFSKGHHSTKELTAVPTSSTTTSRNVTKMTLSYVSNSYSMISRKTHINNIGLHKTHTHSAKRTETMAPHGQSDITTVPESVSISSESPSLPSVETEISTSTTKHGHAIYSSEASIYWQITRTSTQPQTPKHTAKVPQTLEPKTITRTNGHAKPLHTTVPPHIPQTLDPSTTAQTTEPPNISQTPESSVLYQPTEPSSTLQTSKFSKVPQKYESSNQRPYEISTSLTSLSSSSSSPSLSPSSSSSSSLSSTTITIRSPTSSRKTNYPRTSLSPPTYSSGHTTSRDTETMQITNNKNWLHGYWQLILGISLTLSSVLLVIIVVLICRRRQKQKKMSQGRYIDQSVDEEDLTMAYLSPIYGAATPGDEDA